jgi:transcriptional regulator with XRE-family HTH domain
VGDWREFGDELRRLRLRGDLSLRALAKVVNYNAGALSRIQNGKRKPSLALAAALDRELGGGGALLTLANRLLGITTVGFPDVGSGGDTVTATRGVRRHATP